MSNYDPNQPPHFSGQPIPPHLRDDNVIGNSPLNPHNPSSQAYKPKKRHIGRNIAIVIGGLFMLLIVAAVLTPGQPAKDAATAPVTTPVDNRPTPDPVVTPTNIEFSDGSHDVLVRDEFYVLPTREQIISAFDKAIASEKDGEPLHVYQFADTVLALLNGTES